MLTQRPNAEELALWCLSPPTNVTPVVVLVNATSGGRLGEALLATFRRLLHPHQVGDLAQGGPAATLRWFQYCPRFRILVCGGVRFAVVPLAKPPASRFVAPHVTGW